MRDQDLLVVAFLESDGAIPVCYFHGLEGFLRCLTIPRTLSPHFPRSFLPILHHLMVLSINLKIFCFTVPALYSPWTKNPVDVPLRSS